MPKKGVMKKQAEKRTLNPTGTDKRKRGQEPKDAVDRQVGQYTGEGTPSLVKK